MTMPLEGIRVLDWTIWQQGPVCSLMLGELGAEVIKIEARGGGDPGRGITKVSGLDLGDRPNFYFEATNRGKQSITLDLKQPEAKQIVYELVAKTDVFVQNFRKGVAERLGLDYETLRRHNPKLVYASGSGYGPEGPDSGAPSFDRLGLARSGIMFQAGEPDMPPVGIAEGIADQMGAVMLSLGVIAALRVRDRDGIGQQVDASLLGSMMWLQNLAVSARLILGVAIPRTPRKSAVNPLWNHYCCGDGNWLALGMLQPDRYWPTLCTAIGHPEMVADERFATMQLRAVHAEECIARLDRVFAGKPRDQWLAILQAAGDLICTPVNSVNDLPDDAQVRANGYITNFDHPRFGPMDVLSLPVSLRGTPGQVRLPAPELGEHTEKILVELLGYDWNRIAELKDRNVI